MAEKSVTSSIRGQIVRPDCAAAAAAMRCQRLTRDAKSPRSGTVRWQVNGTTCDAPSSVAFSITQSSFAPLAIATASVSVSGDSERRSIALFRAMSAAEAPIAVTSARKLPPSPSKISM